jgi:hypothetical protein
LKNDGRIMTFSAQLRTLGPAVSELSRMLWKPIGDHTRASGTRESNRRAESGTHLRSFFLLCVSPYVTTESKVTALPGRFSCM